MFAPIFEDIFQPMFSDLFGLSKVCQAIRFNGVNNYGQLATRAIDPDGDNSYEFWTPDDLTNAQMIITQSDQGTFSLREFNLYTGSGSLLMLRGGTVTNLGPVNTSACYGVIQTGNTVQIRVGGINGELLRTVTALSGSAREPSAPTRVGARGTGSSVANLFSGLIPYIRINNFYYAMDAVGQAIQPSLPAGNDMTLFNTVPEQWEEISCGLRPEA